MREEVRCVQGECESSLPTSQTLREGVLDCDNQVSPRDLACVGPGGAACPPRLNLSLLAPCKLDSVRHQEERLWSGLVWCWILFRERSM